MDAKVGQNDAQIGVELGGVTVSESKSADDAENGSVVKKTSVPIDVWWNDVTFEVENGSKKILDCVSGTVRSGEMLAVMGPSGSGKTTLLDFLADRVDKTKSGRVCKGDVRFGAGKNTSFGSVGGYVPQHDALVGVLTVRETLTYATLLRYGVSKEQVILESIDSMGLKVCEDTIVGTIFQKGISGGQKRRLSVAVALISDPSVLMLDEPTSGLDSASAYAVVKYLKKLTETGHTVMMTIHQPSSQLWELFDKVHFLVAGRPIYFGSRVASSSHSKDGILEYFESIGHKCPAYSNPADFIIEKINVDFPGHIDVDSLVKKWRSRKNSSSNNKKSNAASLTIKQQEDWSANLKTRPGWLSRLVTLSRRNLVEQMRDPGILGVRLAMYSMLAMMVGFMFWDIGSEIDDASIQKRISIIFYVAAFMVFMSVAVLPFFMMQREVFVQERCNQMFGVSEWVLSRFLVSLPGVFLIALVSTALVVLPSGLNGFGVYVRC